MRLKHWFRNPRADTSSHGRMHAALAAAYLRRGNDVWEILTKMVPGGSFYTSLVTSHNANHGILNVDANGAIPEVINNCLVFRRGDVLNLLGALPDALPRGTLRGILARGQLRIDNLTWDSPAGRLHLELTSAKDQTLTLRLPNRPRIKTLRAAGAEAGKSTRENCRKLRLTQDTPATLDITF